MKDYEILTTILSALKWREKNGSIKMITDGESVFETYSFTALERETGDSSYKKVVNLISRINRG